jgi:hypothetical protein
VTGFMMRSIKSQVERRIIIGQMIPSFIPKKEQELPKNTLYLTIQNKKKVLQNGMI